MTAAPGNITDWYKTKVDRMGRIEGVFIEKLGFTSATLFLSPKELNSYSNQVMVIVSVILLSNWCNSIHIVIPEDQTCIVPGFQGKSIKSIVESLIKDNDDEVNFEFHAKYEIVTDVILSVGEPAYDIKNAIWMEGEGWISGYGRTLKTYRRLSKKDYVNPIGPVFSACLAHAALFKTMFNIEKKNSFSKWFSLFNYQDSDSDPLSLSSPDIPEDINFGNIFQVGCGAVGSSFDFILSLTNFHGRFSLIDFDSVEPPNIISSLLFTKQDALRKQKKVEICAGALSNSICKPSPFDGDYSDFIQQSAYAKNYPDLILCFANEHNIWSTIQYNYPPVVLHATTTSNWGVNYGRHLPLKDWCIVCRFGVEQLPTTPICAEGVMNSPEPSEKPALGILPFLSPASAIITLAELVKYNIMIETAPENFIEFSMKSKGNSTFRSLQMPKKVDCPGCSTLYEDIYKAFLTKSKYTL